MRTIKRDIVGAFIFSKDQKILLGHVGVYGELLAVPGGGMEPGETDEQAVKREILEETGIDITHYKVTRCSEIREGKSEKILRDTGEKVMVEMKFIDFVVKANVASEDIQFAAQDDFKDAQWYPLKTIRTQKLNPPTRERLALLGYIHD